MSLPYILSNLQASGAQVHLLHLAFQPPAKAWTCVVRGSSAAGDKFEVTRHAPDPETAAQSAWEAATPFIELMPRLEAVPAYIAGPPTLDHQGDDVPF